MDEIGRRVRQAARSRRQDHTPARIAKLEAEIAHLVEAIGQGMLSPALRQRLQDAEADMQRLKSAPKPASLESLLPRLPALIRAHVTNLAQLAAQEPVRARAAVRQALETDLITTCFSLVRTERRSTTKHRSDLTQRGRCAYPRRTVALITYAHDRSDACQLNSCVGSQ